MCIYQAILHLESGEKFINLQSPKHILKNTYRRFQHPSYFFTILDQVTQTGKDTKKQSEILFWASKYPKTLLR